METLSQLTTILTGLGVNSTLWIQLGLFLVTFLLLNNLVFNRFQAALDQRHDKTVGGEDSTKLLLVEAQEIQSRYEKRAREVNEQIKSAYDAAMSEATRKQSELLESTRKEAAETIKKAREQITAQARDSKAKLQIELPVISGMIAAKLLGKETT